MWTFHLLIERCIRYVESETDKGTISLSRGENDEYKNS